jgi:hypothetical protein
MCGATLDCLPPMVIEQLLRQRNAAAVRALDAWCERVCGGEWMDTYDWLAIGEPRLDQLGGKGNVLSAIVKRRR